MTFKNLIKKTRSYRRFDETKLIHYSTLEDLVDLARLSASAKNLQPVRYVLSNNTKLNSLIFPCLAWAGYLKDWVGPKEGERPTGYIILLEDTTVHSRWIHHDLGIAAQSILLGATDAGLGGCIIAAIKKDVLRSVLSVPDQFEIHLVLALGTPIEKVVIDPVGANDKIKYWRDKEEYHHVPKRNLQDIILKFS